MIRALYLSKTDEPLTLHVHAGVPQRELFWFGETYRLVMTAPAPEPTRLPCIGVAHRNGDSWIATQLDDTLQRGTA